MQNTKSITEGEAKKKIRSAINKVLEVVAPTLGPAGRSVLLPRTWNRGQRIVDDGYYAAENVILSDPFEKLAADTFKEAIQKTNQLAGDGTTGTAVFAGAVYEKAASSIAEKRFSIAPAPGAVFEDKNSVRAIRKQIQDAKNAVIEEIKKRAKKTETIDELKQIARISIGKEDEAIADKVAEIVWDIARDSEGNYVDSHVDVVEGYKGEIEFEKSIGMKFPAKVSARAFVNKPERHEMVAEDVATLLTNYKLDNTIIVNQILKQCKTSKLAIFAPEFSNAVLLFFVEACKNGWTIFPIKCPSLRTEQMNDLAIYTASNFINKDLGAKLENTQAGDLGFAEKIVVKDTENREDATLLGGRGTKIKRGDGNMIDEQIKVLKGQMTESRNDLERMSLGRRIANLNSAVGVIRVGASMNSDLMFLKMKIEDGVFACKAALEEGHVRGGGLCLKDIAESMPENILTDALSAPYNKIQENAGGYYPIGDDVLDPAKVVRLIVEHGATVASMLVNPHAIIAEEEEKTPGQGYGEIARAITKIAYNDAKHKGLLKDSEDEAEKDRERMFSDAMLSDNG